MNLNELAEMILALKLKYKKYSLQADNYVDDGFGFRNNNGIWEVYYCERGDKNILGMFYSENGAYEYMNCIFKEESDKNRWF